MLGVDAVAIKSHEHWETCGHIAKNENRCILTRNKHFTILSEYVESGKCLALKNDSPGNYWLYNKDPIIIFEVALIEVWNFEKIEKNATSIILVINI